MIGQVEKIIKKQLLSNLMSCSSRFLTVKKIKDRYSIIFGKKIKGHSTYSIISACYNVENYIDDFIESIVCQSLGFKEHIQVILVMMAQEMAPWKNLKNGAKDIQRIY